MKITELLLVGFLLLTGTKILLTKLIPIPEEAFIVKITPNIL